MERLTDIEVIAGQVHPIPKLELQNPSGLEKIVSRLQEIEDILGDTYGLDRLRELAEADRAGRCVPVTKDLLIAILAGLYALNTNKKMRGGMYVFDVHKEHGGPHTMEFSRAAEILAETAERVLDASDDVLTGKGDEQE